jgi:hypothetical protein
MAGIRERCPARDIFMRPTQDVMSNKRNWLKNPTRKEVILVVSVWFIAEMLSLLAVTNMFSENLLTRPNLILNSLNFATTLIIIAAIANYIRNKKKQDPLGS